MADRKFPPLTDAEKQDALRELDYLVWAGKSSQETADKAAAKIKGEEATATGYLPLLSIIITLILLVSAI